MRALQLSAWLLIGACSLFTSAHAQDWPTRTMTLVVPFAAGGGVDVSARIQAQKIGQLLGQSVVVDNMGGAAGMAGALHVSRSTPDGYTMLMGNTGTHAFSQALYKHPPYNAMTDFTPVALVTESPRILIVRKNLPVSNLREFVAYVKAHQANMQFGSAGVGSGTHLPCVLLNMAMGVNVTHVPYRGEGPAQQDLIAGRLDYMCSTIQTGASLAKQGEVKAIAVMSPHRVDIIPGVPTTGEQGLKGVEASVWDAYFLPPGASPAIVRKLDKAISDTLDDPAIHKRLADLGLEIVPPDERTPEYLAKLLPEEVARWTKVVGAAGITPR
ncbi:MAG: Bug family tripartite tricarboxylate transporter substrate binding protein [Xanthobacteraceae bacterium]